MSKKLSTDFYRRPDVVAIARELIGKVLCSHIDGQLTSGIITETEAYCGRDDKASHANNGTRTQRTETMYQPGGLAYVYLCYGIHHLFNVVTNVSGKADAVLVRAIKPLEGIDTMLRRRDYEQITPGLTAGPGRLTQALGITTEWDASSLLGDGIWIEDGGKTLESSNITSATRIGVDYAGADAQKPWRFYPSDTQWVSQK